MNKIVQIYLLRGKRERKIDIIQGLIIGRKIGKIEIIEGIKEKYRIYVKGIFIFILVNNIMGIIVYNKTKTSNIKEIIGITFMIIIGITIISIKEKRLIQKFIPKNIPKGIIPLISIIEIMSYLLRIITLAFRLTTNLLAGHMILGIIGNIEYIGIMIIIPIIILEIGVSVIQAYVFTLLTSIYIKEI